MKAPTIEEVLDACVEAYLQALRAGPVRVCYFLTPDRRSADELGVLLTQRLRMALYASGDHREAERLEDTVKCYPVTQRPALNYTGRNTRIFMVATAQCAQRLAYWYHERRVKVLC